MKPQSICIVGGNGRMGALMARIFSEDDIEVRLADPRKAPESWIPAIQSDVVLISVPIPVMEDVMSKIGPHTRKDGVVIDIASLKELPIQSMLRHARGEVIGSHPLFGPRIDSLKDHIIFLQAARSTRWIKWFRSFFSQRGARLVEMDPARHDRLMSRIQVLRHIFLFCFGRSLMRLDFNLQEDLPLSGPWFSSLVEMLERQLEQGPGLYADLAGSNPASGQVLVEFKEAAREVADVFSLGDRDTIMGLLNEMSEYMGISTDGGLQPERMAAGCSNC